MLCIIILPLKNTPKCAVSQEKLLEGFGSLSPLGFIAHLCLSYFSLSLFLPTTGIYAGSINMAERVEGWPKAWGES